LEGNSTRIDFNAEASLILGVFRSSPAVAWMHVG
jgi:hypothetical protein